MEWFSKKTSIAGIQLPNRMVVLGAIIVEFPSPDCCPAGYTNNSVPPAAFLARCPQDLGPIQLLYLFRRRRPRLTSTEWSSVDR
jgi:hypothetical protein